MRDGALSYSPFGVPDATVEGFAFTGEMRDANGLQFHRARYYSPELGVWPSLDPLELGNQYAYVNGNPVGLVDPSGFIYENMSRFDPCQQLDWWGDGTQIERSGCGADPDGIKMDWSQTSLHGGGPHIFMNSITHNKEMYLSAAQHRLTELQSLMCPQSQPETGSSCLSFYGADHDSYVNMTPEEFASRMVAIVMAETHAGWLADWYLYDSREKPTRIFSYLEMSLTNILPESILERQSVGFSEIRFGDFVNVVAGKTNSDDIVLNPVVMRLNPDVYRDWVANNWEYDCSKHPRNCFSRYIADSVYSVSDSNYIPATNLTPELVAARYLNMLVQRLVSMNRNDLTQERDWYNSTLQVMRCAGGTTREGGQNICGHHGLSRPDRGAVDNLHMSLRWARAVFGSSETDCLVVYEDLPRSE